MKKNKKSLKQRRTDVKKGLKSKKREIKVGLKKFLQKKIKIKERKREEEKQMNMFNKLLKSRNV